MSATKLKSLKTQLRLRIDEYELLKQEVAQKQKECSEKKTMISALQDEITKIESVNELKLSEHAMLRYFERVHGYNLEEVESIIVTDKLKSLVEQLGGNGLYPCGGFSVRIKDYTIVTVVV